MSKSKDDDSLKTILKCIAAFLGIGVLFFHLPVGYWWVVLGLGIWIVGLE